VPNVSDGWKADFERTQSVMTAIRSKKAVTPVRVDAD
jgi:hypothetical protein